MEIPLRMKMEADGGLLYGIPLWYRAFSLAMIALVAAGLAISGGSPGVVAIVVLLILALGLLYEENWHVDSAAKILRHRSGVYPFVRRVSIDFSDIESFSLDVFAKGTIPGLSEEEADRARAYSMMRGTDVNDASNLKFFRSRRRKPYLNLVLKTKSGDTYLVDTLPARRAARLPRVGRAFAAACGSIFDENS